MYWIHDRSLVLFLNWGLNPARALPPSYIPVPLPTTLFSFCVEMGFHEGVVNTLSSPGKP